MNKTDVIKETSKRSGIKESDVRTTLNTMADLIKEKLLFGVNVQIQDFISFQLVVSPEQTKRNPQTKELITVPKKYRVKTILPRDFRQQIKEKTVY